MTSTELIADFLPDLMPLLADPEITDIMIFGTPPVVYVERHGKKAQIDLTFDARYLRIALTQMANRWRYTINEATPELNVRLEDGSRVAAMIAPCSIDGVTLTIRKFGQHYSIEDLIEMGSLTVPVAHYLINAIDKRKNILIAGPTGAGKTALLNALANLIPATDRIITIEDTAEIIIDKSCHHVIPFQARQNKDFDKRVPDVTLDDLLHAALRHNPDRIVLGEVRGGEAWSLLQSLNTGHQGSLSTIHANSALAAIDKRLTHLVLQSGIRLPYRSIREAIAEAINVVVYAAKDSVTGLRRVTEILEVLDYRNRRFITRSMKETA